MEVQKPVNVEEPYIPPNKPPTVPFPVVRIGELLPWKGWFWVVTETNAEGKVLLSLKEPTDNAALRATLHEHRLTKHLKKTQKRQRTKAKVEATYRAQFPPGANGE